MNEQTYTCRGIVTTPVDGQDGQPVTVPGVVLDAEGQTVEGAVIAVGRVTGQVACGRDVTARIAAIPSDGVLYEFPCPSCGANHQCRKTPPAQE